MNEHDIATLQSALCASFAFHETTGAALLQTPFYFPDGDGLPLFIERTDAGWRISDHGARR